MIQIITQLLDLLKFKSSSIKVHIWESFTLVLTFKSLTYCRTICEGNKSIVPFHFATDTALTQVIQGHSGVPDETELCGIFPTVGSVHIYISIEQQQEIW